MKVIKSRPSILDDIFTLIYLLTHKAGVTRQVVLCCCHRKKGVRFNREYHGPSSCPVREYIPSIATILQQNHEPCFANETIV